jgi:hypothetical protein
MDGTLSVCHVSPLTYLRTSRGCWPGRQRGGASCEVDGFHVYATASEKHHEYLKGLGASRVFDYKSEGGVESIVTAAKEDGVTVQKGFDAAGQLQSCLDILKEFKGGGDG